MNATFNVRRAGAHDRPEALHAFVHGVFGALSIDPPSSVLKETVADFGARLKSETGFLAEASGDLIGSVFCGRQGDVLHVGRLAVAPAWRRRGVASTLLEATKEEARRIGAAAIVLGARIALPGNVALFKAHGFEIIGESTHRGYAAPTSYDMRLSLAEARTLHNTVAGEEDR